METRSTVTANDANDFNMVEIWLQRDPVRWIAGIFGGLIAAAIAAIVAGAIANSAGMQFLFPVKLMATPFVGAAATELDAPMSSVLAGMIFLGALGAFWGFVWGHFVFATRPLALVGMGLTWGAFSWVFLWNLLLPSFRSIHNAHISPAAAFFVCIAFGLGMISVSVILKAIRPARA